VSFLFQKNISKPSSSESIFAKPLIQNTSSYNYVSHTNENFQNKSVENKSGFSFQNIPIRPKLKISHPDDPYEKEADRMSEKIVNMHFSDSKDISSKKDKDTLNRKCAECELEKEEKLGIQRKTQSSFSSYLEPPTEIEQKIDSVTTSQGFSLDSSARNFMESRFGFNFGDVRIHTDSNASKANASISARAFTMGNDIYFNHGEYNPETTQGRKLLAHELTHVVQQTGEQNQLSFETNHLENSPLGTLGSLLGNDMMYPYPIVNSGEYVSIMNLTNNSTLLSPSWSCGWKWGNYWAASIGLAVAVGLAVAGLIAAFAPEPAVTKAAAAGLVLTALLLLYAFIAATADLINCLETDPDADRREIERLNREREEYNERIRELEDGLQRLEDLVN